MCGERHRIAVARYKAEVDGLFGLAGFVLGSRDMADDIDIIQRNEFLVVVDIAGEEEFIILAAIECTSDDVQIHLFRESNRLVVDRQFVLVDIAAYFGLCADMEEFGGESVGDIHHSRRMDACFAERTDYIHASFWFELSFEQVFASLERLMDTIVMLVRLGEVVVLRRAEDLQFALKELQSEIRRAEIACDANEVADLGAVAIDDIFLVRDPKAGDSDGQSVH